MLLLFIADDVIAIKGRGVLATGPLLAADARFRVGDPIQLHRHNGSIINAVITGIPMGMMKVGRAEVVLGGIEEYDIAPGDEVWLNIDC